MNNLMKNFRKFARTGGRLKENEDGMYIAFTALSCIALFLLVASVYNVGIVVGEKMSLQNTTDAVAYSQAIWEARVLNFIAYTNRSIISYMVTIAFVTAVHSQEKLWKLIKTGAKAIPPPPGPPIQAGSEIIYNIWKVLRKGLDAIRIRDISLKVMDAYKVVQGEMLAEFIWNISVDEKIQKTIAHHIDNDIQINREAGALGLATVIPNVKGLTDLTGLLPSEMNFESLKNVYIKSMDGFSDGSSFPRSASPPVQLVFAVELAGGVKVEKKKITQSEKLVVKALGFKVLGVQLWAFETSFDIAGVDYDKLKLGEFDMYNAQKDAVQDSPFPSVWSYAQKSSNKIPQFRVKNIGLDRDLSAFSRAEVFYWDPDRSRSQGLGSSKEPNLFNPFWHARLAPAKELPFGLSLPSWVPITH